MSHIRIAETGEMASIIPQGLGDFIVGLEPMETLRVIRALGSPEVCTLTNTCPIAPIDVIAGNLSYPDLSDNLQAVQVLSRRARVFNASDIALEMGNPLLTNMRMVEALIGTEVLPLTMDDFVDILSNHTNKKSYRMNAMALKKGMGIIKRGNDGRG